MKHLCLKDDRIVLSNYFRKRRLTVLENGLPAVKKELPCYVALLAVTAAFMGMLNSKICVFHEVLMPSVTEMMLKHASINKNCISLSLEAYD